MKKGLIRGIGRSDADYSVYWFVDGKKLMCPIYSRWKGVLERCYGLKCQRSPSYEGCLVDERWHSFMSFREWMLGQPWQGNHLDKDILSDGVKRYSPETCVFIPQWVNTVYFEGRPSKLGLPVGVSTIRNKQKPYMARINNIHGQREFLGSYATPEEAHFIWKMAKAAVLRDSSALYRMTDRHDERICKALEAMADRLTA